MTGAIPTRRPPHSACGDSPLPGWTPKVLLGPDRICLGHPSAKLLVEVAQLGKPKGMKVIPGGKGLHPSKARMLDPSSQDKVTVQPPLPRYGHSEGHPEMKGDTRLLWED